MNPPASYLLVIDARYPNVVKSSLAVFSGQMQMARAASGG
jgi:hypothetical protein